MGAAACTETAAAAGWAAATAAASHIVVGTAARTAGLHVCGAGGGVRVHIARVAVCCRTAVAPAGFGHVAAVAAGGDIAGAAPVCVCVCACGRGPVVSGDVAAVSVTLPIQIVIRSGAVVCRFRIASVVVADDGGLGTCGVAGAGNHPLVPVRRCPVIFVYGGVGVVVSVDIHLFGVTAYSGCTAVVVVHGGVGAVVSIDIHLFVVILADSGSPVVVGVHCGVGDVAGVDIHLLVIVSADGGSPAVVVYVGVADVAGIDIHLFGTACVGRGCSGRRDGRIVGIGIGSCSAAG